MNLRQFLTGLFLGIGLGIYDTVFATFVPTPFSFLRLTLPIIAFCIAIERVRIAIVIAATAGLIIDLFSIGPSGVAFARLVVAAGAAWLLQSRVLTNRSLYTTILLACVVQVVDTAWMYAASGLQILFRNPSIFPPMWDVLLKRVGMDIFVVACLFLFQTLMSRRFSGFRRRT
jgi:cell shape-determining protein MreD